MAVSSTAIRLDWSRLLSDQLPGVLEGYDFYFSSRGGRERHVQTEEANATTKLLISLEIFTEYSITVAARTGGGIGPRGPSPPLMITTKEDGKRHVYSLPVLFL